MPANALGLDNEAVIDPWGNKIEYVVSNAMYKSKSENATNNYYSVNGALQVLDVAGNTLEPAAAYILISRGKNQLGGWASTSNSRVTVPLVGSPERDNLECDVATTNCGSTNFNATFRVDDTIDDFLLYSNKNGINADCAKGGADATCNNVPCNTYQWLVSGNSTITVTPSNLPQLLVPNGFVQQGMSYSLTLTLNAMNTPSSDFYLMYEYTTTSSTTVQSREVARFNTTSMVGQFDTSYIGNSIEIPFGESNHIPNRLYFVYSGPNNTTSSMTIANATLSVKALEKKDKLDYDIWTEINCFAPCTDNGNGNKGRNVGNDLLCKPKFASNPGNCTFDLLFNDPSYPDSPTYHSMIDIAEGYSKYGFNYFSRISGYFTPDETATYTFYIASDSTAQLYISSNENANNAQLMASRTIASGSRAWTAADGGQTVAIPMVSGKSYFLSLVHIARNSSNDNLALGCSKQDDLGTTPIDVLGLGTTTTGCGGTLSTAPLQLVLNQVQCQ